MAERDNINNGERAVGAWKKGDEEEEEEEMVEEEGGGGERRKRSGRRKNCKLRFTNDQSITA